MKELEFIFKHLENIKSNFKLFYRKNDKGLLLHKPTLTLYVLDKQNFQFFKELLNKNEAQLREKFKKKDFELKDLKNTIEEIKKLVQYNSQKDKKTKKLERLALFIAQECPLECVYCYGKGGTYGKSEIMSLDILEKSINVFYSLYDKIETIQFFGGEPLVNIEGICKTIEILNKKIMRQQIIYMPKINIITGLGVSKKVVEKLILLLKKNNHFNYEIIVSFDGPKKIQNLLRPFKKGLPSYDRIVENLNILKEINQPKAIEVTYTKQHLIFGISHEDLKEFFKNEFDIEDILIRPVMSCDENLIIENDNTLKEIEKILERPYDLEYKLKEYISILINSKPTEYYCNAGISSVAISASGDIYPCQLVVGDSKFAFGSIQAPIKKIKENLKKWKVNIKF
ncbi:hypothetical protein XJ44_08450 [Thermosipho affectus]|uniref:Radical SAM core domain-containing protein n=1 Tax=Thermosipho affectus TaxID=660294 RepID=A0ABX3IIY9_9BACT|nr:radical SAM protein [Thermosipho affectus]ONN26487.1 hypothetical protein XJ44_08450 [Thermosipho affectus]